jgi:hypothetical protein
MASSDEKLIWLRHLDHLEREAIFGNRPGLHIPATAVNADI